MDGRDAEPGACPASASAHGACVLAHSRAQLAAFLPRPGESTGHVGERREEGEAGLHGDGGRVQVKDLGRYSRGLGRTLAQGVTRSELHRQGGGEGWGRVGGVS